MNIKPGSVVLSRAGRDAGRYFIVKEVLDEQYVSIVDGELRKIVKPKKKKLKHVRNTGVVMDELAKRFKRKSRITNSEIRDVLKEYQTDILNDR